MKQNKKTLCYLRPYNKSQLYSIAKLFRPKDEIKIFCEHPSVDQTGLPGKYYSYLKNNKKKINNKLFNKTEKKEIITRCRLLRNIKKKDALKHLDAMSLAINSVIRNEKPNLIFLQTVDNYISHIMYLICKRKKIKFIGIVTTPINNYFRITSLGECNFYKNYNKNLKYKIYKSYLKKDYVPVFNQKSISNPKKYIFLRWIRNSIKIPFFFIKRLISGDYYNYHSWSNYIVSLMNFNLFFPIEPGDKKWEEKINQNKNTIYIPLQMFPEATIDYACEKIEYLDYYKNLFLFIKNHHNKFNIVIKEHPNIMGFRPPGFYKKIKHDNRVNVIPTYVNSNLVLNKIDCVLVWTGSVGFDALIRGIPVISFCNPYYASSNRFLKIDQKTSSKKILQHMTRFNKTNFKKKEALKITEYMAKQLLNGNYKYHVDWSYKNINDLKDIKIMANSLKRSL